MSVINTLDDLKSAITQLQEIDPRLVKVVDAVGIPPLRRRPDGFDSLVDIIVGQQVSRASADAIMARMRKGLGSFTPEAFQAFSDETFAAQGLSKPKIRTFRALSETLCNGDLELPRLRDLTDEDVAAELTKVKGIGPWTAEVYLLACLGRADIWPAGDIALQAGVQMICDLEARPTADESREIAKLWHPWRSVAARLAWAYYARTKKTKIPVS